MPKGDAEIKIKEIWSLKSLHDQISLQGGKPKIDLAVFFRKVNTF